MEHPKTDGELKLERQMREAMAVRYIERALAPPFNLHRMLMSSVSIIAIGAALPPVTEEE